VIGTTGSGKTLLARQIGRRLRVPHIELDALFWGPDWTSAPLEVFRQRVTQALGGDAWVVDGNYSRVRDIVWERADTVIWLDYALPVVMARLLRRTLRRCTTGEELWGGNRETFRKAFLSGDSILLWALKTYWRRKREYPELLRRPEHARLAVLHLRTPKATRAWLSGLQAADR
jgi:adenylate kinase family enzyme